MNVITIEGPGKNALGTSVMNGLLARLREADGAPVLLTGAGDAFSAGLNLKEVGGLDAAGMDAFLRTLEALISALYAYPGPTVALVNGHAIAGGCVLTLCCDHRVARADEALRIGLNEVALGLEFPPGTLRMVRDRVPPRSIAEVVLGSALHGPADALRLGLVDEVTTDAEPVARRRLEALAAHPRVAYAATKRALRGTSLLDAPGYEAAFRAMLPSWTAPQVKERIAAALQKKKS
jgi:enoyl-CoA hydratase